MKDYLKVEAVLFGSGKYLTEDEISSLSGVAKKSIKHALSELKKHYASIESSLDVFNEGNSWKLNVKEDFAGIVKNVISEAEMPRAIMETLALIAYKSPVLQSEIIDARGSGAYDHISLLEDKGFISKEKSGRSFKLRTAPRFFEYFDIDGDSKLRAMFKNVKKPEQLGNLEVYTAKTEEEKEVEFSDKILERMKKVETTPTDHDERAKFLGNFEEKYVKAKTAIDETDRELNEFRRTQQEQAPVSGNPDDPENVLKKFDAELEKLEQAHIHSNEDEKEHREDEESSEQKTSEVSEQEEPATVHEDEPAAENEEVEEKPKPHSSHAKKSSGNDKPKAKPKARKN